MRRSTDPLDSASALQRIAAQPWRFDFYSAMRLIENQHRDKPRLGSARRSVDEPVRLGQEPDLSFAATPLHSLTWDTPAGKPRLQVRFFGLFGPNGPLPTHLTEYARQRQIHPGDVTFARFADLFHHRLLLLFYRAWAQAQPTVGLDRPQDDAFSSRVRALIGGGASGAAGRSPSEDHGRLFFSGLLANQSRNADGLASILTGLLGKPVRVEQFVGAWLVLSRDERTRIGGFRARGMTSSAALGGGAVLGEMVWDRQHNFRIHVGPMDLQLFESLLPKGRLLPAVVALVESYVGIELSWDLSLSLAPEQVIPCRLGQRGRLGWTSWLGTQSRRRCAGVVLAPRALPEAAQC